MEIDSKDTGASCKHGYSDAKRSDNREDDKDSDTCQKPEVRSSSEDNDDRGKSRFVLHKVRLKNFIKFYEEEELTFDKNGAYYLIGENQSGKSSIFEAIRRCISVKYNSSVSSAFKNEEDSVVVCIYKSDDGHHLVSFYIRRAGLKTFVKGCAILDENDDVIKLGIDHFELRGTEIIPNNPPEGKTNQSTSGPFGRKAMKEEKWLDTLAGWEKTYTSQERCEKLLEKNLANVVFTFPMRGIGALQWSESPKIKNLDNYMDASNRAEVINWFLTEIDHLHVSPRVVEKEKEFHEIITNRKGGEYKLGPNGIQVDGEDHILKQSEGFNEAKLCSILLAQDKFHTICLEDPGTGMHVQMIERLRMLMSSEDIDKVVIISTHNPSFINPEFIKNMYFLRKDNRVNKIKAGKDLAEDRNVMSAIPGSVSNHDFANICFTETIVFVEGPSDVHFLEALATYMRQNKAPETTARTVQFVSMGGKDKRKHFGKFCKILKKEHYFILDNGTDGSGNDPVQKHIHKIGFDSLEGLFFQDTTVAKSKGVFPTFKDKDVCIRTIQDILLKCSRERIEFHKDCEKTVIKSCVIPDTFKIFLHGEETLKERVGLVEFLMNNLGELNTTAKDTLENLHKFLKPIIIKEK